MINKNLKIKIIYGTITLIVFTLLITNCKKQVKLPKKYKFILIEDIEKLNREKLGKGRIDKFKLAKDGEELYFIWEKKKTKDILFCKYNFETKRVIKLHHFKYLASDIKNFIFDILTKRNLPIKNIEKLLTSIGVNMYDNWFNLPSYYISPTGKYIIFKDSYPMKAKTKVIIIDVDKPQEKMKIDFPGYVENITVSPKKDMFALLSYYPAEYYEDTKYNLWIGSISDLTKFKIRNDVDNFSFSPDGKEIAYVTKGLLKIYDLNTKQAKILDNGCAKRTSLAYSPDGQKIAYQKEILGSYGAIIGYEIYVIDKNSLAKKVVAKGESPIFVNNNLLLYSFEDILCIAELDKHTSYPMEIDSEKFVYNDTLWYRPDAKVSNNKIVFKGKLINIKPNKNIKETFIRYEYWKKDIGRYDASPDYQTKLFLGKIKYSETNIKNLELQFNEFVKEIEFLKKEGAKFIVSSDYLPHPKDKPVENVYIGKILLTDLNNDNNYEKIVTISGGFYTFTNYSFIIFQRDKKFISFPIKQYGEHVISLDALDINNDRIKEIVISWGSGASSHRVDVSIISPTANLSEFKPIFNKEIWDGYFKVYDIDNDKIKEVIISEALGYCPTCVYYTMTYIYKWNGKKYILHSKYKSRYEKDNLIKHFINPILRKKNFIRIKE